MTKQVYAVIKIEIEADENEINTNESALFNKVEQLEVGIEEILKKYRSDKLLIRIVPEWETEEG